MTKMRTKIQVLAATIGVLSLSIIVGSGNIGSALALSDQERYNVGHHEGALQASIDEQTGYYNSDCQRYDNSHSHTDAYCQGYVVGYNINWQIFKNRHIILGSHVQASQSINQRAQINCFLAICGKNSIGQGSSQDQNVDTNTAIGGN